MRHDYDFYRFTRLVVDLIIRPFNLSIPYDIEMDVIEKFYDLYEFNEQRDNNPYDGHCNFINDNKDLIQALKDVSE